MLRCSKKTHAVDTQFAVHGARLTQININKSFFKLGENYCRAKVVSLKNICCMFPLLGHSKNKQ